MIDELRRIPMFASLPDDALSSLASYIHVTRVQAGEAICREGEVGTCLYFIQVGEVQIIKQDRILSILHEGDVFGEMALFEGSARSADTVAVRDTTVYELRHEDFRRFLFDHPDAGVRSLLDALREMSTRLRNTSNYLVTVFETGKIVGGDLPLSDMAEGIVSRLLASLDAVSGGMILILNPFVEMYETTCAIGMTILDPERAAALIQENMEKEVRWRGDEGMVLGIPLKDERKILGYLFVEKGEPAGAFTTEEEIIVSAVASQVGLGIYRAYNKQEEEARQRLEQARMRRY